jgi:hypothetical protein
MEQEETQEYSVESLDSCEDSEESEKSYDDLVQLVDTASLFSLPVLTPTPQCTPASWELEPTMKLSVTWQYDGDAYVSVDFSSIPYFQWQEWDLLVLWQEAQQQATVDPKDIQSLIFCSYPVPSSGSLRWERKVTVRQ